MKKFLVLVITLMASTVYGQFEPFAGGGWGNGSTCTEAFINPTQLYYAGADYMWLFFPDPEAMEIRNCSNTNILKRLAKVTSKPLGVARNNALSMVYASLENSTIVAINTNGVVVQFQVPGVVSPVGLAVGDSALWIADKGGNAIWRQPLPSGIPIKVIPNLHQPEGISYNNALYVADTGGNKILKRDAAGVVSTIAGTGTAGFSGDGGPAVAASLNKPLAVVAWDDGSIYIADSGNNRIRRVVNGNIMTVLGNGQPNTSKRKPVATDNPLDFPVTGPTGLGVGNVHVVGSVSTFPGIWYADYQSINTIALASLPTPGGGSPSTPTPAATNTITPTPKPTCVPECTQ